MRISISYASKRKEVWQWYWRTWRRKFWKTHAVVFATVATSASLAIDESVLGGWARVGLIVAIGIIPLVVFVLFPMVKFKPQIRTLEVDEAGIVTAIADRSYTLSWEEFCDFHEDGDAFVLERHNLNAFIIPSRAFQSVEAMSNFRDFVAAKVLPRAS